MSIITAEQLRSIIEKENPVIVDARGGGDALERYQSGHLENALFADLETDLSEKAADAANGGRHPLPTPSVFGVFLGKLGITPDKTVAVYDDKKGANAAARFWWMLKAAGHEKVFVVSGGLDSIKSAGLPVTQDIPNVEAAGSYPISAWSWPLADIDLVSKTSAEAGHMVIDVREHYRYIGESEPIDLVAGHIPGAENIPYTSNLDEQGEFLSPEKLAAKYKEALGDRSPDHVIVHCGSGVTACHTLLALDEAGLSGAALYVGSWSEWSRNDKPIAIGNN